MSMEVNRNRAQGGKPYQYHTAPGPDSQVNVWHSLGSTVEIDRIQQDGVVGLDPTARTLLQKSRSPSQCRP